MRPILASLIVLALLSSCGGDKGDDRLTEGSGTPTDAAQAAPTSMATGRTSLDVCALIDASDLQGALSSDLGEGVPDDPMPPFFGCSWRSEGGLLVHCSVIAHADSEQARGSYQMGVDVNAFPEVEGLGDAAYNSQPVGDVTVLQGSYELSIAITGLSYDDDSIELEAAKLLAARAIARLP